MQPNQQPTAPQNAPQGQSIGEQSIPAQQIQQTVPEAGQQQGQMQLLAKLVGGNKIKNMLDEAFKLAAKHVGATFNSRVKNADSMIKKVAQKRLQKRDYDIDDINDAYGGRFITDKPGQISNIKKQMEKMEDIGLFKIKKEEPVKHGTYDAYHYDIESPDGHRGEVQIHTAQSELEAVANHDLRAVHGEKPQDKSVEHLKEAQLKVAKAMPPDKARSVTDALQQLHKNSNNQPLPPHVTAAVLASANQ